jgi:hypothetical protein
MTIAIAEAPPDSADALARIGELDEVLTRLDEIKPFGDSPDSPISLCGERRLT